MISRLAATTFGLLLLGMVVAAPAIAAPTQCEGQVGGSVGTDGSYSVGGESTCGADTPSNEGSTGYRVERTVRPEPSVCPDTPDALQETFRYYLPGTTTLVNTFTRCVGANVPDPALPPPPPSAVEVFASAPLPPPEVHVDPQVRGLVGLETYLWWGADTALPALSVTAGEWSASIAVEAGTLVWDMGNGDVLTTEHAGTGADDPSATYVYERQCDCTITLTVEWSGVVTLTHPLAPAPVVQSVGPVAFTSTRAFTVEEREAVIVG